ncbi:MAG: response regulator [Patescibacteria group bacterium]
MKILIIDDEISAATTLKALLMSQDGMEIDIAYNGREGLAKMKEAQPPYDLLILDVMMPDFSGLDVCKAMHADEQLKNTPIILDSALPIASKELQGLLNEFQALNPIKGVLEKPFVLEDLLAAIKAARA